MTASNLMRKYSLRMESQGYKTGLDAGFVFPALMF
jgi:hypothetical protein